MAVDPNLLLQLAGLFGQQQQSNPFQRGFAPAPVDPRVFAQPSPLQRRPQAAPQRRPAPVAPQSKPAAGWNPFTPAVVDPNRAAPSMLGSLLFGNPATNAARAAEPPANPNQSRLVSGVKSIFGAPDRMAHRVLADLGEAVNYGLESPAEATARQQRAGPIGGASNGLSAAIVAAARELGTSPQDLATVISYETGGTFDPNIRGGKNNAHVGLIQFGAEEQRKYGIKPGMSVDQQMPAVVRFLKDRGFKPGMDIRDLYSTINAGTPGRYNASDGNGTVASHVEKMLAEHGQKALQALGQSVGGALLNPFDPRYGKAALNQIDAAENAALTPFSTTWNQGAAPTMPEMEKLPTTDFSKADAALEALRPVEQSEKDKLAMEREGFFGGIAKAMMSANPNDGFGTFLMRMGGAALGGKFAAKDEIRQRHDQFEEKMAKFNAAVYQNETGKAQTFAAEAKAQVQQNNQFALTKWQNAYQQWQQGSAVDISGSNVVRRTMDATTGQARVDIIPIAPAVKSAFAMQRAGQYTSVGSQAMQGASMVASATNGLVTGVAAQALQQSMAGAGAPQEQAAAAAAAPAFYATHAVRMGQAQGLLGEQGYSTLMQDVKTRTKAMMDSGMLKPEDVADTQQRMVAEELARLGLADPAFMQRLAQAGAGADMDVAVQRTYGARTRTSRDSRGRTTTTTTSAAEVEGM